MGIRPATRTGSTTNSFPAENLPDQTGEGQPFRYLHDCSDCFRRERIAGWALHPLESAAFARRTPKPAVRIYEEAFVGFRKYFAQGHS